MLQVCSRAFIILLSLFAALTAVSQKRLVSCRVTASNGQELSMSAYLAEEVDEPPQYPGGEREMIKFINNERQYPSQAYEDGIQGRVLCSFIILEDGSLSFVDVIRGVEKSLNDEAIRVIEKMPRWSPGKIDGTPVATYCILPIALRK